MEFVRKLADRWHRDVPGARWFKADLHIHTVDDIAGKRAKMPPEISGSPENADVLGRYARRFLQSAIGNGVQVLGITPHSPRVGSADDTSAVWRIVDAWNNNDDDDGVPFREKIYAVFPGFEPCFAQGDRGIHLAFLFDPEIGRETFMSAFEQVMGGVIPWKGNELQVADNDVTRATRTLTSYATTGSTKALSGEQEWDYITFAPHIDGKKGLFQQQKAQILDRFPFDAIAGLELNDDDLPADRIENDPKITGIVEEHRLAFFHASDSYKVEDIGTRHTWFKLASPRIEALRQAFIASDSRVRVGFERTNDNQLRGDLG